jgi:hypothetical protein
MRFQPGFLGGGSAPTFAQAISFSTHATDITNLAAYTFAATNIGAATTDRLVVVSAHTGGVGTTGATCTIGGTPATPIVNANSSIMNAAIFSLAVPTTETAMDIGITWNTSAVRCSIGVYALTGLNSQTVSTFGTDTANGTSVRTVTLNTPAGGLVVGAMANNTGTATNTWTNATITFHTSPENLDSYSGALAGPGNAGTKAVTVQSASTQDVCLVAAVWA